MTSFSAELHVQGYVYPILRCSYDMTQATDSKGRVVEKVRYHPIELLLDVPMEDFLLTWAADKYKQYPANIVFLDAASKSAIESLSIVDAHCVSYWETFVMGDTATGAYQCILTLTGPTGFTLEAGTSKAFVAPTARDYGLTVPASIVAAPPGNASTSTCPESIRVPLQNEVVNKCKGEHRCRGNDDCPSIERNIDTLIECIKARIKIMEKCYKGGDRTHKLQVQNKVNALITCQELLSKKCSKSPQPEPVLFPSGAPSKAPVIPKEAPLTTAAVVLFILFLVTSALRPGPI